MAKVTYQGGWNGGSYSVDGKPFAFKKKVVYNTIINGHPVPCFVQTIHSYDSDHGHRYDWSREDLYFNVSVFGIVIQLEALPYIEQGLLEINL